jgi:hypothetical protein
MQRSPDEKAEQSSTEPQKQDAGSPAETKKVEPKPRKFHNGWTKQLEVLVAEWADKSACYRWMHEKTEAIFSGYNMYFTIPVIVLSTLTGTANFAIDSFLPDPSYGKYATAAIGGISIITGIISTVANFLRYAQSSEAHRVAGVSWGKFQRFISTELALHPNERMDAMSFLKMGRIELDRLIEQSPTIPAKVIKLFEEEFKNKKDIKRPEIAGGIETTRIFDDRDSRVAKLAAEAAFFLQKKRGYMKQLILEDLDKHIANRTKAEREQLEAEMMADILRTAREAAIQTVNQRLPKAGTSTSAFTTADVAKRSPPNVPENTVVNARAKFEKVEKEPPVTATRGVSLASVAQEAARKAIAMRTTSQTSVPPSPSNVRLEIVSDDVPVSIVPENEHK